MNLFKKQIILYIFLYGGILCIGMGVAGNFNYYRRDIVNLFVL